MKGYKSGPLPLQAEIGLLCLLQSGFHIAAGGESGLGRGQHGLLQLTVDFPQAGHPAVGLGQMLRVFGFPVGFGLGQPVSGPLDNFCAVCHFLSLPQYSLDSFQLRLPKFAGGTLGHRCFPVAAADLRRSLIAGGMPAG